MYLDYIFVLSHKGNIPSDKALVRFAYDSNGRITSLLDQYTGGLLNAFKEGILYTCDLHEASMGRRVVAKFGNMDDLEFFNKKLSVVRARPIKRKSQIVERDGDWDPSRFRLIRNKESDGSI